MESLASDLVVFAVRPDPKPMSAFVDLQAERPVVEAHACAVELSAADGLEMQRGVVRIGLEQSEVAPCQALNLDWQHLEALPEAL